MASAGHYVRSYDAFAVALARGATVQQARHISGVSQRTASRRLAEPAFRAQVNRIRQQLIDDACGRLADGLSNSIDVLRCLLTSDSELIALRAATAHLDHVLKLRDSVVLEERIAALERATHAPLITTTTTTTTTTAPIADTAQTEGNGDANIDEYIDPDSAAGSEAT